MKCNPWPVAISAILAVAPLSAKAELTGNDLLSLCTEVKLACVAYMQGYTVGLEQGAVFGFLYKRPSDDEEEFLGLVDRVVNICAPEAVSNDQLGPVDV